MPGRTGTMDRRLGIAGHGKTVAGMACLVLGLSACAGKPPEQPAIEETRAELQAYIASDVVSDDRGRFREIFCAVLADHGPDLPDYRTCEEALRITGYEVTRSWSQRQPNLFDSVVIENQSCV